jgi:hypothetical protein
LLVEKEEILKRYLMDFQLKCLIKRRVWEITLPGRSKENIPLPIFKKNRWGGLTSSPTNLQSWITPRVDDYK